MLMEALRKICYLFFSSSPVQASSSLSFLSSALLSLSKIISSEAPLPPTPSSLSGLHLFSPFTSSTFYKIFAFLALLSLLPSSPPCSAMVKEADLQKMFKLRNENDWKSLWHAEKHVRCRDQLLNHMDWACQKDIYRLEKKFQGASPADHEEMNPLGDVFIGKAAANTIVKPWGGYGRRKREEKSITDECCSPVGCTWEEYAEYCPAHRRLQTRRFVGDR